MASARRASRCIIWSRARTRAISSAQRAVAIDDSDNALTLYRKLVPLGVELHHAKCIRRSSPALRRGAKWISRRAATSGAEGRRTGG